MHEDGSTSAVRIPIVKLISGAPGWEHTKEFEVVATATVDEADAEYLGQFRWLLHAKANGTRYAHRATWDGRNQGLVYMHGEIWTRRNGPVPVGMTVDHENRDGLDNRSRNLRLATTAQQGYNKAAPVNSSTGYKGVHWASRVERYKSFIRHTTPEARMRFYLGSYLTAGEAATAYNHAAQRLHGEFARLNEIPDRAVSEVRSAEILAFVLDRLTKPVCAN